MIPLGTQIIVCKAGEVVTDDKTGETFVVEDGSVVSSRFGTTMWCTEKTAEALRRATGSPVNLPSSPDQGGAGHG